MKFVKAAFVAALAVTTAGAFTSRADAAPPPTNVAAMKAARWTHQSCKYAMAAGTEAGAIEVGAAMAAGVIEAGFTGGLGRRGRWRRDRKFGLLRHLSLLRRRLCLQWRLC